MARSDKDRFLKELAIRLALTRGMAPVPEVAVPSLSDLSDSVEVLTDLDVLGVQSGVDGVLRRTIFDCKSSTKMSPINRAFWAAGVREYARCDEAFVILGNPAVVNHRLSALSISVDLHDEKSFKELGRTIDVAFPADNCYQSSIDRWFDLADRFSANSWAALLLDLSRNTAPLSQAPWSTFRKILAELRKTKGHFDPTKDAHVAIFLDVLASTFILWTAMGRDIRRFYNPSMDKTAFETVLRFYLWGGKETYQIRHQLHEKANKEVVSPLELPNWSEIVLFASLVVGAPQNIFDCSLTCRELAIRSANKPNADFDKALQGRFKSNSRIRQFSLALSDTLVSAGGLPTDMKKRVQELFSSF
ncbi:hypothetical protein ACQR1N_20340 [Bradyrhizobium sp. HKCCYLRH1073]|uniref:hypothetical protein n=1 Tax=unclassified Bradyrhizobium TaxID=2631580 RepID=UPI003EBC6B22